MHTIFEWSTIETNKVSGIAKTKCPACIGTRRNKTDRSLYVNFNSGVAKCFNCEALSFREGIKKEVEKKYTIPVQTWRNYTTLSEGLVKYFEDRKISQSTLIEMSVTEEKYYQPAVGKEVNNVVFNYFEGDVLVNKKYRTANKKFTQSKDGKPIFYNINSLIGETEAYIVEGEIDVLSVYQIGIKNVISVPNGANDNDAYWINSEPYLKEIKKYYIAVDNDEKGNDLAEKIAQRLGRWRCERVDFDGKDANDDLKSGVLERTIYKTTKYPVSGTFTSKDLFEKMINLYDSGLPPTLKVNHSSFGNLNDVWTTMLGHTVVGTGIPSHGKSNFTEWYLLNLAKDNNLKLSFFSPEHMPMELHQSSFVEKAIGKSYFFGDQGTRLSKLEITQYVEWANEKIYLTAPENGEFANWDWLIEKFKEQLFNYGINIFVIDAYNKVENNSKRSATENVNYVMSRLTQFSQMNRVSIFLIAHPTKMRKTEAGKYESPTLYDVSGSADFRNQAHDGFSIYRNFNDDGSSYTTFTNLKTKYKFQGTIGGKVEYDYHLPSGRYYEKGGNEPTFSLIERPESAELELPLMMPDDDDIFNNVNPDEETDMPF